MSTDNQKTRTEDSNPFEDMGFIQFWIVSTLFWMTFPLSVAICYLTLGSVRTKQLVKALVNDFLQTLLVILVVVCMELERCRRPRREEGGADARGLRVAPGAVDAQHLNQGLDAERAAGRDPQLARL